MRGGSPPDQLYEDFSKYFVDNYDIFKDNDWFLQLSYTLQEMGADPYEESLLVFLTCYLAIVYMEMKENDDDSITLSDEVNHDFIERFVAKTKLYFPKGKDGNVDRRFIVDFLSKLTDYVEKINLGDNPRINLEDGKLDDESFLNSKQVYDANSRWRPYKLEDGRRIWQEDIPFKKAQQRAKKYAENPNHPESDFNLVGRLSQRPTDIGMRVNKNQAKEISETAKRLRESLIGDPDVVEKQVDDLLEEQLKLKSKGYGLKIKDYKQNMLRFKNICVENPEMTIKQKFIRIKRKGLFTYAIFTLQKLIIEIDIGKYGLLDQKTLNFEKVKQKVKFLRLKKGLDIYGVDQGAMEELDIGINNILDEYRITYKLNGFKHRKDPELTPYYSEKLSGDDLLGDYHVSLNILQDIQNRIKAFTNNVNSNFQDLINQYKYYLQYDITNRKAFREFLNTLINEMDDLLMHYYMEMKVIMNAYHSGEFSDYTDIKDERILEQRNKLLKLDKYWYQMMKVTELGFYEKFLYDNFGVFDWDESLESNIHISGKEVFMELFAHAEILREQLHPTEDNPPLCIMPHLVWRDSPRERLKLYTTSNLSFYRSEIEKNVILPEIKALIRVNSMIKKILSSEPVWIKLNKAKEEKDITSLFDIANRLIQQGGIHKKPNQEEINRIDRMYMGGESEGEIIDDLVSEITESLEPYFIDYISKKSLDDSKLEDIFVLKEHIQAVIETNSNRLYDILTGDYIQFILEQEIHSGNFELGGRMYNKSYLIDFYDITRVIYNMLEGNTSDVEYSYNRLQRGHPKGDEIIDESMFDEIWQERKEYRKSVREGRKGYVHPNFSVEQDPYDYDLERDYIITNDIIRIIPKVGDMDEKQRLRTQKLIRKENERMGGVEYLPIMKAKDIFSIQEKEIIDKGNKDWITAQQGLTDGIQKAKLMSDIKDLSRLRLPRGDPENIATAKKIRKSYDKLSKDYGGMLRKSTILPRRLRDNRKLKSGVFKAEAPLLEDLKGKLKGLPYDALSNFADYVESDLELELMDSNPELFDVGGLESSEISQERRDERKRLFIEKIIDRLEDKEFDGSDEIRELYDERLNLFNIVEANKEGERILYEKVQDEDLEGIIDFLNDMYVKVGPFENWRGRDINDRLANLSRFSLYYDGEQLYKESVRIFNKIIEYSNLSKNNQMDLSAYVDYSPREYKMQLYSNGQPELDPYRNPLIDYSRDVRVSPLDYKTKDMFQLLSGIKQTGVRDDVPLYSEVDFFRPLNQEESTRRTRFQTSPNRLSRNPGESYTDFYSRIAERRGGGYTKKRTHRRSTRTQRKIRRSQRKSNRNRMSINKRRSQKKSNRNRRSINKRRSQRKSNRNRRSINKRRSQRKNN